MTEACFGERLKMMKAMIVPIAATILALTTSAKADNTDHSASYYLPGCRDFAIRWAAGNVDRMQIFAKELVGLGPDVIRLEGRALF